MEDGPTPNLLPRERRSDLLLVKVSQERQQIERALPRRIRRKLIRRQRPQIRPVIRRQHELPVGCWVVRGKDPGEAPAAACDLLPETAVTDRKALRKAVIVAASSAGGSMLK